MLLTATMTHLIKMGRLTVIDSVGKTEVFEGAAGPTVTVRLHESNLRWKLALNPQLYLGEAYMDGLLTVEDASLYDLLDLLCLNLAANDWHPLVKLLTRMDQAFRRLYQFNPVKQAAANAALHYDLSSDLYGLFLDSDRQYSCAYFERGDEDLETAQLAKKRHIAAKLLLQPGMKVLDIGSGWGGMALYLARKWGAEVTGITLSREQLEFSQSRARKEGLDGRVSFHLRDYREQTGSFDRIVSVGMFEHVGVDHYGQYFGKLTELLKDDGVALLHTIGRADGPSVTDPWIRKYIFPGGYCPALSEILPHTEKARLATTDVEVLRLHYAQTLRHWRRRFMANRKKAAGLYDERFCRMWEYYMAASEISFRRLDSVVFQIQMAKQVDVVPQTRSYIEKAEQQKVRDSEQAENRAA